MGKQFSGFPNLANFLTCKFDCLPQKTTGVAEIVSFMFQKSTILWHVDCNNVV
jgi:hypothetical protein